MQMLTQPYGNSVVKSTARIKTAVIAVLLGIPLLCIGLAALPWLDAAICVPRAAKKIGVEPTYPAIYAYITKSVTPGMTRDEALAALGRIGTVRVPFTSQSLPEQNTLRDQAYIDMCAVPFNDIQLFISYRSDTLQIVGISIEQGS